MWKHKMEIINKGYINSKMQVEIPLADRLVIKKYKTEHLYILW